MLGSMEATEDAAWRRSAGSGGDGFIAGRSTNLVLSEVPQSFGYVVDLGDVRLLEGRGERHRRVRRGDPLDRRVEVLERLLGNRRGNLGAEAAGPRVFVEHR